MFENMRELSLKMIVVAMLVLILFHVFAGCRTGEDH